MGGKKSEDEKERWGKKRRRLGKKIEISQKNKNTISNAAYESTQAEMQKIKNK